MSYEHPRPPIPNDIRGGIHGNRKLLIPLMDAAVTRSGYLHSASLRSRAVGRRFMGRIRMESAKDQTGG